MPEAQREAAVKAMNEPSLRLFAESVIIGDFMQANVLIEVTLQNIRKRRAEEACSSGCPPLRMGRNGPA